MVPNLQGILPEVVLEAQPNIQPTIEPTGCCPRFDPAPWQDQEITWLDEPFVQDHLWSVFHVPLRMGRHVTRNQSLIDAAGAAPPVPLMLSDEKSPWGTDLYIRVTKPVPGARMARLSGTFLTRVYEGPYRDAPSWAANMQSFVATRGRKLEKLYFAYTTCPACSRAYGKNYVVLFAKVG
jgi:hypothetical protein